MSYLRTEAEARQFVRERIADDDLRQLDSFAALLGEANSTQNLVSRPSLKNLWVRHIADSAQLLDHVPRGTGTWIDLGTGAGFPGLILAMLQPQRSFLLVESRTLRIQWLNRAIREFGLAKCSVAGMDLRKVPSLEASVISARAFAPLNRLVAQSARFSTASTHWVLPKGRSAPQEVAALPVAQRAMFHVKQSVTDPDAGIVVGFGKVEIAA